MYQVEARLKWDFLAARTTPPAAPPQPRAPAALLARRHALSAVALLLASFLVSDLVTGWGGPYACP
jgi:hypothetical protein